MNYRGLLFGLCGLVSILWMGLVAVMADTKWEEWSEARLGDQFWQVGPPLVPVPCSDVRGAPDQYERLPNPETSEAEEICWYDFHTFNGLYQDYYRHGDTWRDDPVDRLYKNIGQPYRFRFSFFANWLATQLIVGLSVPSMLFGILMALFRLIDFWSPKRHLSDRVAP